MVYSHNEVLFGKKKKWILWYRRSICQTGLGGKKNEPFSSQKRREIDGRSEETDQTLVISIYVLHPGHPWKMDANYINTKYRICGGS